MAPKLAFRCSTCNRVLKTLRGIEEHIRKVHGNFAVTSNDYKLFELKDCPKMTSANKNCKLENAIDGGNAGSSGRVPTKFKPPLLNTSIPQENTEDISAPFVQAIPPASDQNIPKTLVRKALPVPSGPANSAEPSANFPPAPSNTPLSATPGANLPPTTSNISGAVNTGKSDNLKVKGDKVKKKKKKTPHFDYFKGYTASDNSAVEGLAMWASGSSKAAKSDNSS